MRLSHAYVLTLWKRLVDTQNACISNQQLRTVFLHNCCRMKNFVGVGQFSKLLQILLPVLKYKQSIYLFFLYYNPRGMFMSINLL